MPWFTMEFNLPIYIRKLSPEGQKPYYQARPLFFEEPLLTHGDLQKLIQNLSLSLRRELKDAFQQADHQELARWSFCPEISIQKARFSLKHAKAELSGQLYLGSFRHRAARLFFLLDFPDWWFVLERGEDLESRLNSVLKAYLKAQGQEASLSFERLNELKQSKHSPWIEIIQLELPTPVRQFSKASAEQILFGFEILSGALELERTGICLDEQENLTESLGREQELAQLSQWLSLNPVQPVALIGPHGVGKSALVQHYVCKRKRSRRHHKRKTWLLSPLRLQAGMMYVGQWETRLLAILKEIAAQEHLLYIDNLPGWYQAGRSSSSDLSMGQLLHQQMDKLPLRLLIEMTPECLLQMQELDRGLMERFQLLHLEEMNLSKTFRVAIRQIRQLERSYENVFLPEVLLLSRQLQQRFEPEGVFPGKLLRLLDFVARQNPETLIGVPELYQSYNQFTGLSPELFAPSAILERTEIENWFQSRILGQAQVISALADLVLLFRAGLNDPERPIASFLFLGPTGVGKTETAKALAEYFFSSPERLIRFDMNEYQSSLALARLTGTLAEPDGLLTQAVRQQPFAVILLDEIEKAHVGVFDLLLQMLGEGRLTDAHGRTAYFTNTLIILTSNLGAAQAHKQLGFNPASAQTPQAYRQAAEAFFRPELFNRLDQILPFAPLQPEQMLELTRKSLRQILGRQGLSRRKLIFDWDPAALQELALTGYHPELGARYLKRHLERQIAMPLARLLASHTQDSMSLLRLSSEQGQPQWQARQLTEVQAWQTDPSDAVTDSVSASKMLQGLESLEQRLWRIQARLKNQKIAQTQISIQPDAQTYHLYAMQELAQSTQELIWELRERLKERSPGLIRSSGLQRVRHLGSYRERSKAQLDKLWAAEDLHAYLKELKEQAIPYSQDPQPFLQLRQELALLEQMAQSLRLAQTSAEPLSESICLSFRCFSPDPASSRWDYFQLPTYYQQIWGGLPGLEVIRLPERFAHERLLWVRGLHAQAVASLETGIHLFDAEQEPWLPTQVSYFVCSPEAEPEQLLAQCPTLPDMQALQIVRLYLGSSILDLRTGLLFARGWPGPEAFGQLLRLNLMHAQESQLRAPQESEHD